MEEKQFLYFFIFLFLLSCLLFWINRSFNRLLCLTNKLNSQDLGRFTSLCKLNKTRTQNFIKITEILLVICAIFSVYCIVKLYKLR